MKNLAEGYNLFNDEIIDSLILHIPHSRTLIPDYTGMNIAKVDYELKTLTDHNTEDIFYIPGVEQLVFPYSRLFCDVERLPDEFEPMFNKGKGFFYTRTEDGSILRVDEDGIKNRVYQHYLKHHRSLRDMVDDRLERIGMCTIIDCHSFPGFPLLSDEDHSSRPDICIGTDINHTPSFLIDMILHRCKEFRFSVKIDSPYRGTIIPIEHADNYNVHSVMIEINRDLYMNNDVPDYTKIHRLNQFIRYIF